MLSMQHILSAALHYGDSKEFEDHVGAVVFPDAVRMYTGRREYTHFEESKDGNDISYWKFPTTMKDLNKEEIQKSLEKDGHLCENIQPCAIGERTWVKEFRRTNNHLPRTMYEGIEMHLRQDVAFDDFIRREMNCSGKYDDVFVMNGKTLNGKEARQCIGEIEQFGIYYLAKELYEKHGVTANQEWFDTRVKPALDEAYSAELSENTYRFMKLDDTYNALITNHDWSKLEHGPVSKDSYATFYQDLQERLAMPSGYEQVETMRRERELPSLRTQDTYACDLQY